MTDKDFSLELIRLTQAANNDFIKCKELREFLDANAEMLDDSIHSMGYGLARTIVNSIAGLHDKDDLKGWGSAEIVHRDYKNILAHFIGEDTSPVIKLLAQRAALSWLRLQQAESEYTMVHNRSHMPHDDMKAVDQQLTGAQNRFLRACTTLAKMRAMLIATDILKEKAGKPAKPKLALVSGQ